MNDYFTVKNQNVHEGLTFYLSYSLRLAKMKLVTAVRYLGSKMLFLWTQKKS